MPNVITILPLNVDMSCDLLLTEYGKGCNSIDWVMLHDKGEGYHSMTTLHYIRL